ncbi:MAG: hypothetical protein ABR587_17305 [Candidatus Binatia bacterium]
MRVVIRPEARAELSEAATWYRSKSLVVATAFRRAVRQTVSRIAERPGSFAEILPGIRRYSGRAFSEGIETHRIERQSVRVYSVAKTLADLFKARNRIGLDVAVEALREAWRDRRFTMSELDRAARACRVERVMRPYLEGVVA